MTLQADMLAKPRRLTCYLPYGVMNCDCASWNVYYHSLPPQDLAKTFDKIVTRHCYSVLCPEYKEVISGYAELPYSARVIFRQTRWALWGLARGNYGLKLMLSFSEMFDTHTHAQKRVYDLPPYRQEDNHNSGNPLFEPRPSPVSLLPPKER